jgi:lipopolysaccharide biosynthesis glycosyltransferase
MKLTFAYVTDAGGMELARHSAVSLALSQKHPCDIHIFCYRFEPPVADPLHIALRDLGCTLRLSQIADGDLEKYQTRGHVTKPALLRLLAVERLIVNYDRVVYLDNDVLVHDDLAIEDLEFGSLPIAAVVDMDLTETGAVKAMQGQSQGAIPALEYFNSGLIICEARNWRTQIDEFRQRYISALEQHDVSCVYKINCTSIDQCAANSTFHRQWLALPTSYNMQATAKFTRHWKTAIVRHYCGTRKFVPASSFRNDGRDIAYLNRIRNRLQLPPAGVPLYYELLYRLNFVRNYLSNRELRSFIAAVQARN